MECEGTTPARPVRRVSWLASGAVAVVGALAGHVAAQPLPLAPGAAGARALAADGAFVVAGAPGDDLLAPDAGATVVTEYAADGSIVAQNVIRSPLFQRGQKFGWAVGIEGDVIAVGAPSDLDPGRVERYERVGGKWTRTGGAGGAQLGDQFGFSVAVAGGRVFVGIPGADIAGSGSGRVVELLAAGDQIAPLGAPATLGSADRYGHSIDAEAGAGELIVVSGAPLDNVGATDSGSVFVNVESNGVWQAPVRLAPPSASSRGHFGYSVAVANGRVFVGSPHDGAGRVDVFERVGGSWVASAVIVPPVPVTNGRFGAAIDARGDSVIVGADREALGSGRAHVFALNAGEWTLDRTIDAPSQGEGGVLTGRESSFASSVALSDLDAPGGSPDIAWVGAPALLEAAITNPGPARGALRAARDQRVELVLFGDSNANFGGDGHAAGMPDALRRRPDMQAFATGVFSPSINSGLGAGLGDLENEVTVGVPFGSLTGAPPELDRLLPSGPGLFNLHGPGWLDEGETYSAFDTVGLAIQPGHPLDAEGTLQFRYNYASFRDGSAPDPDDFNFTPLIRLGQPPFTQFVWERVSTLDPFQSDPIEMRIGELALPPGPRAGRLNALLVRPNGDNAGGRAFVTWFRVLNDDRDAGWAFSTRSWEGGQGLRVFTEKFRAYETAAHTHYFDEVRRSATEKGQPPRVLVVASSALNDRTDTQPSVGANPAPGNTPAGYADNLQAFLDEIRAVWSASGWPDAELDVLFLPSHSVNDDVGRLEETRLARFRRSAVDVAGANADQTNFDWSWVIDPMTIDGLGFYDAAGRAHLESPGYRDLSAMVVDALLAPDSPDRSGGVFGVSLDAGPCGADWDQDGSVTIFDILVYLSDFESAVPDADLNTDGEINIFDVLEFLVRFESGCP